MEANKFLKLVMSKAFGNREQKIPVKEFNQRVGANFRLPKPAIRYIRYDLNRAGLVYESNGKIHPTSLYTSHFKGVAFRLGSKPEKERK